MAMQNLQAQDLDDAGEELQHKPAFLDCLNLVERLHRRLLDIIRDRLEAEGRTDINAVQALLIYNIGDNELTAGELRTRGYYLGSNVTYNLKKLVELGYVSHRRSRHDKRSVRIALEEKGREIRDSVNDLYDEQLQELLGKEIYQSEELNNLRRNLRTLERFWSDQLHFL